MNRKACVFGTIVFVLVLGLWFLTSDRGEGQGTAWKPLLSEAQANGSIKFAVAFLDAELKAGAPPVTEISKQLEEQLGKKPDDTVLKKRVEVVTKQWHDRLLGTAGLIAVLAQSSKQDAQLATMRDAALELKASLAKKDYEGAKKKVAELSALKANAKASVKAMPLHDKIELMDIMRLFKLRNSGGLGFSAKPGAVAPDGMEARLLGLSRKVLTAKEMEAQAEDIARMAHIMIAAGQFVDAFTPTKKVGMKDPKDWRKSQEEMVKSARALADAAAKKDAKAVQTAARLLNSSCSSCHTTFRD